MAEQAQVKRPRGRPRKVAPPVTVETSVVPAKAVEQAPDTTEMYGVDIDELMDRRGIPNPPKWIMAKFEKLDRVWRWLSVPHIRKGGGWRGYEAYSPDEHDRKLIDAGKCPPGIRIHTDNRVMWNEDAFLGWRPGRLDREIKRRLAERTHDQTKLSKNPEPLQEEVARTVRNAGLSKIPRATFQMEEDRNPTFGSE